VHPPTNVIDHFTPGFVDDDLHLDLFGKELTGCVLSTD
jgi:hypothetical protein